jgi:hypothetical protein
MVSPVMAGEDPYIAIVGNDCIKTSPTDTTCSGNPFYVSPKYQQFMYNEVDMGITACYGTFPAAYSVPLHPAYGAGCEQFRSLKQVNAPEICDTTGVYTNSNLFVDRGNKNSVVGAGNTGWYEWYIRLPKKPDGEINLVLQCGVLKPNTFALLKYETVSLCAAETGERIGTGFCTREEVDPGVNPLVIAALPKITAIAYPGPFATFTTPFNLTAFRNPGTYNPFDAATGNLVNGAAGQILDGSTNTRILLKSCMDKTIVAKIPVTGQVNAAGQIENDLEEADLIYIRMDIPRQNTVDIYCHAQSARVMGIGEEPFN